MLWLSKAARDDAKSIWQAQNDLHIRVQQRAYEETLVSAVSDENAFRMFRTRLAMSTIFQNEAFFARAVEHSGFLHLVPDSSRYGAMVGSIVNMPNDEVREFVNTYLAPERARVVYIDVEDAATRQKSARFTVSRQQLDAQVPAGATSLSDPPSFPLPAEFGNVRQFVLKSGLRVLIARRPGYPTVTAAMGFGGGWAAGQPPGVVQFVRGLQDVMGTSLRLEAPRQELNGLLIGDDDGPDATVDLVRAGATNLPNALYLLADRLTTIDTVDWRRIVELMERSRRREEQAAWEAHRPADDLRKKAKPSPYTVARRKLADALYGPTAYTREFTDDDFKAFKADDVAAYVAAMHHPKNAHLVIVGDVDLQQAEDLVHRWFDPWKPEASSWPAPQGPKVPDPRTGPMHETLLKTKAEGAAQTSIALACRLPNADERASATHAVLAQMVERALFQHLREQNAATYSASAGTSTLRGGASELSVNLEVDSNRTAHVVSALRSLWKEFATTGFDNGSLALAKWHLNAQMQLAFQTSVSSALSMVQALTRGSSFDAEARLGERVVHVTMQDISRAFSVCSANTALSLVADEPALNAVSRLGVQAQASGKAWYLEDPANPVPVSR